MTALHKSIQNQDLLVPQCLYGTAPDTRKAWRRVLRKKKGGRGLLFNSGRKGEALSLCVSGELIGQARRDVLRAGVGLVKWGEWGVLDWAIARASRVGDQLPLT